MPLDVENMHRRIIIWMENLCTINHDSTNDFVETFFHLQKHSQYATLLFELINLFSRFSISFSYKRTLNCLDRRILEAAICIVCANFSVAESGILGIARKAGCSRANHSPAAGSRPILQYHWNLNIQQTLQQLHTHVLMIFEIIHSSVEWEQTNSELAEEISQSLSVCSALKVLKLLSLHHQRHRKSKQITNAHHDRLHHCLNTVEWISVEASNWIQQLSFECWHMYGLVFW